MWCLRINVANLCERAIIFLVLISLTTNSGFSQPVKIAPFKVNISPPIGSPAAYAPTRRIVDPLTARGIVLECKEGTIVLCAVDYIGIGNKGLDAWRLALAEAAGTSVELVNVHSLHQHDGVRCDLTVEEIMTEYGLGGTRFDVNYIHKSIGKVAKAVKKATHKTKVVTHLGFGQARVEKVASNRRVLGPDGTVVIERMSSTRDSAAIAASEGVIDPMLKSVSFWQQERPLAVMTYYATHPQSYYGQGDVNAEFVGMARAAREKSLHKLTHIHFNGAGGNVAAGKYNDGSVEMRPVLAERMERGMKLAWENTVKMPLEPDQIKWKHTTVALPLSSHLIENELRGKLGSDTLSRMKKLSEAKHLAWLLETRNGREVDVATLQLGQVQLLHLPGELFVEYQLAAQALLPDQHICVAAYGDYGPGYIGTKIAYSQGGYEVSPRATRVSADVEEVLMTAIRKVLVE